jgi:GNAT superfamily N-acetyltransferase
MSKVQYDIDSGVPGVRLATPADEAQLFALLLMLHKENGMFGLNPDKVVAGIQWATKRQGGIIFCIDEGSKLVASLGMCVTSDWYSDDEYLLERWNYVHPEHRRSDYARKLIEQAKWTHTWFKRQGFNMPFQCGINSFDRTEAKVRLYARHMPCIGAFFMYGEPPFSLAQAEKYREEVRRIEEMNRKVSGMPVPENRRVVPLVETILKVGG